MPIVMAPGTASTANASQSWPFHARIAATSNGPDTAPIMSRALCTPNPRPAPIARFA